MLRIAPLAALLAALAALQQLSMAAGEERLNLKGRHLRVVTVPEAPFVLPSGTNGSFRGFYVDVLDLLAKELNFTYTLYAVADSKYGQQLSNGSWVGLIADVINKKADVALAPLRITANREKYVDFTVSVSSSGMSIVIKRPMSMPSTDAALFVRPFAPSTWILLILFYIIYSSLAFTIWLLSPYELGQGGHGEMAALRRAKKAGCSGWMLVTGGLFVQGFARTPKSPSARILASVWWLFTLVTVCCYLANLVPVIADMRASRELELPFQSLEELVAQTAIPYGVLRGAASHSMLKNSTMPSFQRANKYLDDNPGSLVDSVTEGIQRARAGRYAFLAESLTAEYHTSVNCDLTTAATGITALDFALAVPKDSELRCILNEAILKIKVSGQLTSLKTTWWTGTVDCSAAPAVRSAALLPGDFVCLYGIALVGALLALLVLPLEMHLRGALLTKLLPGRRCGQAAADAAAAPAAAASDAAAGDVAGPSGATTAGAAGAGGPKKKTTEAAAAAAAPATAAAEKKPLV